MLLIRFALTTLLFALCSSAIADVSEAFHTIDLTSPQPPVRAEDVLVYTYLPKSNYKIIGKIYARGMAEYKQPDPYDIVGAIDRIVSPPKQPTEQDDIDLAMNAIAEDASKIGANGVVIINSQQIRITEHSSERKIIAIAFRHDPPDSSNTINNDTAAPTLSSRNNPTFTWSSSICSTSSDCNNARFCYARRCETPRDYNLLPRQFPAQNSSSTGQACAGDEHCMSGLYCSHETNRCAPK
jgi:hypothetical protein